MGDENIIYKHYIEKGEEGKEAVDEQGEEGKGKGHALLDFVDRIAEVFLIATRRETHGNNTIGNVYE